MIICSIPYNAEHPRKVAKASGANWNAAKKVWEFPNAQTAEDLSPKLRGYIVSAKSENPSLVSNQKGFGTDEWLFSGMNGE